MTQTLSSGCCTNTRTTVAITVPYSNLYTLRAFYIIAMISDSYYLIPILGLLCFYVWLGLSTFNEHDDDCMHIVKISILTP